MKTVKCKSGLKGWQANLHEVYDSLEEFQQCCELYGIAERLGYDSVEKCWEDNPLIKGSTIPSDLQVVKVGRPLATGKYQTHPELVEAVKGFYSDKGTTITSVARACRCSISTVNKILAQKD